jgi:hypothetical protein
MINWKHPWKAFNMQEEKESYFLGELLWELESHPEHELSNRNFTILGWIPGYDYFIIKDSKNNDIFYLKLNWNKDGKRLPPCFKPLLNEKEAMDFIKTIKK